MDERLVTAIKLVCILYLIYFLPHLISKHSNSVVVKTDLSNQVKNSFQVLLSDKNFDWVKNLKLAIVSDSHPTNQDISNNVPALLKKHFKIKKIFIPKKLPGDQNIVLIQNDTKTNAQTYHWNKKYIRIPKEYIDDIDAFVFDMKNTGIKQSKSFTTLVKIANLAAQYNKNLIILDKPNPIGPYIEGAGLIPIRHGLSNGELAEYLNKFYLPQKANLTVIPLKNWERNHIKYAKKQTDSDVSLEKAFLKIISQVNPINKFHKSVQKKYAILLPYDQSLSVWEQEYFKNLCLKAGLYPSDYSIVTRSKRLNGIKFKLRKEQSNFSIYNTFLTVIRFLNNRNNVNLNYQEDKIDSLNLIPYTKDFLDGKISFANLKKDCEKDLINFYTQARSCLIYYPDPKIIPVKLIRT
ncbi:MAG: exo-beta-N-acetylmuramidase NamZ domain-containing protein [bacterium]